MRAIKIIVGAAAVWAVCLAVCGLLARITWEMLRVGWNLL